MAWRTVGFSKQWKDNGTFRSLNRDEKLTQGQHVKFIICSLFSGYNGGYSAWSEPGECSQSCGGGVRVQSRTCTNPKPSLNGADCQGGTRKLAAQEWCNIKVRIVELSSKSFKYLCCCLYFRVVQGIRSIGNCNARHVAIRLRCI
jgi:hypothetical protein